MPSGSVGTNATNLNWYAGLLSADVGLFDAFTKIKAAEGMGGFYAGCAPAIQRAALVNLGEVIPQPARSARSPLTLTLSLPDPPAHPPDVF